MSIDPLNLSEEEVGVAGGGFISEFCSHFATYKLAILPRAEEMFSDYRKQKLEQFNVRQIGYLPETAVKPIFSKESFLGSWKRFEEEVDEKKQLLGGIFHEIKNEIMQDAFTLNRRYGIPEWQMQFALRKQNIVHWGRLFSSSDYDNFSRDLHLLQERKDLAEEGLHLEPNQPCRSVADQVRHDEAKSLRTWAYSYQLNLAFLNAEPRPPEVRQAHLQAVWRRTAQLQENNQIPLEHFERELHMLNGNLPEFKKGIAEAKHTLSPTLYELGADDTCWIQNFQTVRGPGFTIDILESAPFIRLYAGPPQNVPEDVEQIP